MIDTLLFDLDNTLLDFDKAEAHALTKALDGVAPTVLAADNQSGLT